jgi:hypothetical protein
VAELWQHCEPSLRQEYENSAERGRRLARQFSTMHFPICKLKGLSITLSYPGILPYHWLSAFARNALYNTCSASQGQVCQGVGVTALIFVLALQAVTVEGVMTESEFAARVHPAVLRLGLAYADGSITGGNARCVALLATLRTVLQVRVEGFTHGVSGVSGLGFQGCIFLLLWHGMCCWPYCRSKRMSVCHAIWLLPFTYAGWQNGSCQQLCYLSFYELQCIAL